MKPSFRTPRSAAARTLAASGAALLALTLLGGGLGAPAHSSDTPRLGTASAGSAMTAGAGCGTPCAEPRP